MNSKILVVGGAGYIGSHCCLDLKERGLTPVIVDNFSTSNSAIPKTIGVEVEQGDISDYDFCVKVIKKHNPIAVMHFAAFAYVGESVLDPLKYYINNFSSTVTLLKAMITCDVKKFIFSSTCATYGTPETLPITESTKQNPINPYGRSKLFVEHAVKDFAAAYGLQFVMFRYFNAAGAHQSGIIGEDHNPETHLIPLVIDSAINGSKIKIFGSDYPTNDGTCVRDYIHVSDIAAAHSLGFEFMCNSAESRIYNIGNGNGYSNLEVIKTVEKISNSTVNFELVERRAGDPPVLVADATLLKKELNWNPKYPDLESIVQTAYKWHKK
jgi:UDP-glucose 4-epimerase